MRLNLLGHDYKYEAEQIILLFFPQHENVSLTSEMFFEAGRPCVGSRVEVNGKTSVWKEKGEADDKKSLKNLVKRSAFYAAQKLSKLEAPWGILTGVRPAKPVCTMLMEGREDIKEVLRNEYLVSDEKIELALSVARKERALLPQDENVIDIYIGIPFCPTRCIYCSFVSQDVNIGRDRTEEYTKTLVKEIEYTAAGLGGKKIRCIYFGGGTPTALSASQLKTLLESVAKNFNCSFLREYTVEAGRPDTVTEEKLSLLKEYGIGRISINPQTVHDKTLELIGRKHTYKEFYDAFSLARRLGFENINCDVIAGLPGENVDMFSETLDRLTSLAPECLTVHTLYIKRAAFLKRAEIALPSPNEVSLMLSEASRVCSSSGYQPYYMYKQKSTLANLENIGYSKDKFECLYNIDTMTDAVTTAALGAGGVSKVVGKNKIERIFNYKNADDYIKGFEEMKSRKEHLLELLKGGGL